MVFDYELMFTDEKTGVTSTADGVIGRTLDLVGAGQGKGFRIYVGLAFKEDITAGDGVTFSVETADNEEFSDSETIALSIPKLTQEGMKEGSIYGAPLPLHGLERYLRLKVKADSAVTLSGMLSGLVFDVALR